MLKLPVRYLMNSVYYIYDSVCGKIMIESDGSAVTLLKTDGFAKPSGKKASDVITDMAARQLDEYFDGRRNRFDVPLCPRGTDFQVNVWNALCKIPYGETRSYKQIAQAVDKPGAYRAVGLANNRNPIWIMIPCHRVIGSDGTLTGYGGGLKMKQQLLDMEKQEKRGKQQV